MGARVLKKEGVYSDMASHLPVSPVYLALVHIKLRINTWMRVFKSLPEFFRTFTGLWSYRYFGYHCHLRIHALRLTLRPLSLRDEGRNVRSRTVLGNVNGYDSVCHQTL